MENDDLYDDLPHFDYKAILEKLQESNKELKEQVLDLTGQVTKLTSENEVLVTKCNRLLKNVSSVIKTGRLEIKRKDLRIAELNREISIIKARLRLPRNFVRELTDSRTGKNETIRQERRSRGMTPDRSSARGRDYRSDTKRTDPQERRNCKENDGKHQSLSKDKNEDKKSIQCEVKINSPLSQTINETDNEVVPLSISSLGKESVPKAPNISIRNTNENACAKKTSKPLQAPNISLPTLYSQRMFRKIYNLDSPKDQNNIPNEDKSQKLTSTSDTEFERPDTAVKSDPPMKIESSIITTVSERSVAFTGITTTNSKLTIEPNQNECNDVIGSSSKTISYDLMNKPESDLLAPLNNNKFESYNTAEKSSMPCLDKINNDGNEELFNEPKELAVTIESDLNLKFPEETKRSMSLEEELHLSSDSRLDGASTNIIDIHLNIHSSILKGDKDIKVEELKNILSNLNKLNDSKKSEDSSITKNDEKNLLNPSDEAISKKSELPTVNTPPSTSPEGKNSEFCSATLGLRLMNRQTKTLVQPISTQWSESCKKILDNEYLLKNKNESFLKVPKTPPRSENKENNKQDIVESLFGSPLKWTENSVDDVPSKLCPPPSAFEDSCSAQIENAKFKKLNSTENVSSTKTVKEIIVSKNESDMSTMTIESHVSVQKIKEVPQRPFELLNNEKKGTKVDDTNSSITLTTLSGSVKSLRKSPICSKYHDSILGTFDDTTQLISELAKEHSKISPITTPIKENKIDSPGNKIEITISPPALNPKTTSPLSNFKNKIFNSSPSANKVCEKRIIFLEKPINILCPRRKAREDNKKKVFTRNTSKNENECDKNKERSTGLKITSSPSTPIQKGSTNPICSKELNISMKPDANPKEVIKNIINDSSPKIENDKFNLNAKNSTPSHKQENNFSKSHYDSHGESRRPSHENNESHRPSSEISKTLPSEKQDDRGLKRRLPCEDNLESEPKRHLSSEKNNRDSRQRSSEKRDSDLKRRSSEKQDREPRRRSLEKYDIDSRRYLSEKYDRDSKRRNHHSHYNEGDSRRQPFPEKYGDCDSRKLNSHDRGSNSSRNSFSNRHDNRHRDRRGREYSPFRKHENYTYYYDENGRKKVSFSTISTKDLPTSKKKIDPPKEVLEKDKSVSPPNTPFKRPLSYERIRRSNCLFRETSVERRIWKNVRHRIRKTPVKIIKKEDVDKHFDKTKISEPRVIATPSPDHNTRTPQTLSPDDGYSPKPPVHVVRRTSKKIGWSASPIQVISAHPAEDPNRPKPESLMKWVLQPIDFHNIKTQACLKENDSIASGTPNKTPEKVNPPKAIPTPTTVVRITRNRPVKFGASEISAQVRAMANES